MANFFVLWNSSCCISSLTLGFVEIQSFLFSEMDVGAATPDIILANTPSASSPFVPSMCFCQRGQGAAETK